METVPMKIIARIHSDFPSKFGVPRQSGLVEALKARVVFEPDFRSPDGLYNENLGTNHPLSTGCAAPQRALALFLFKALDNGKMRQYHIFIDAISFMISGGMPGIIPSALLYPLCRTAALWEERKAKSGRRERGERKIPWINFSPC